MAEHSLCGDHRSGRPRVPPPLTVRSGAGPRRHPAPPPPPHPPPPPCEAAQADGPAGLRLLRHITLPLLVPVLSIVILLRVIDAVKTFAIINTMTKGGPGK